jgi:hypothetical protein
MKMKHHCLAAGAAFLLAFACQGENKSAAGNWSGTLEASGVQLRLIFHITESADQKLAGTLDSIDQGAKDIPGKVKFEKSVVTFEVPTIAGIFQGTNSPDGKRLIGSWKQGAGVLPLELTRIEGNAALPARAANPESIELNKKTGGKLVGNWEGSLETGGAKLRIVLKFSKTYEGGLLGALDSPDQKASDIPISKARMNAGKCVFTVAPVGGEFEGELKGDELVGIWRQGGAEFPLTLARKK